MATVQSPTWLTDEIADFLANAPSREQLLTFRVSDRVQQRARELLDKLKNGKITEEEQWELDQFEHAEMLMQLVKAKVRSRNGQDQ